MKEKQMEVLMVEPGKYPYVTTIENELEAMQKAVGGYIEAISLDDGNVIILNEEGKLMGLEGNRALGDDILVGHFFIAGSDGEHFASLSKEHQELYENRFHEPEQFTQEEIEATMQCGFFVFNMK